MPNWVQNEAYASVVDVLVQLRREQGLSQVELARRLGKRQQFVSLVENRERRLDVVEFCAFVRAMGAEPEAVFGRLVKTLPHDIAI